MYCLYLLLRCVPNFLVHTGGFVASVFCHSSNGESFAAIRVGQQPLQGSHLAPTAFLRYLRDTHLESASVAVDGWPVAAYHSVASLETAPTACAVVICLASGAD